MGRPKALLPLPGGGTLLGAHLALLRPRCAAIAVVGGAVTAAYRPIVGPSERLVVNPDWAATGPAESLAIGLAALPPGPAVVVPVDTPPARPGDLDRLIAAGAPAVLCWEGRPGHPVLIDAALRRRLCSGPPPEGGLRALLAGAGRVPASDAAALYNLNTPEQWASWLRGAQGSTV